MPHVTFIHGIANKPAHDVLLKIWRDSLAKDDGVDLGAEGVTSSMVYWADVMYAAPQTEEAAHESNDSLIARSDEDIDLQWREDLDGAEQAWTERLAGKLDFEAPPPGGDEEAAPPESGMEGLEHIDFERVPLPWWLKQRIMKVFLRDVHHYLFDAEHSPRPGASYRVRDEIRQRFVEAVKEGARADGPHVVVSHSMGTVIAYDCIKRVADCPPVDALMTIGSPLGLDEVQDKLKPEWSRDDGFPATLRTRSWVNVYDRLDPVVGFDPVFANDYRSAGEEIVTDINEQNWGRWRHNIVNYLAGDKLRAALAGQLGI